MTEESVIEESATGAAAPAAAGTAAETAFELRDVTFHYDRRPVLRGLSLRIRHGETVALVGRNGCGKSTLLRLLGGMARPSGGSVLLDGRDIAGLGRRATARRVAILHQSLPPVPGMTARQLVRQGRFAHRGVLGLLRDAEDEVTRTAMERAGVAELADRPLETLSGGERQRVRLALALAQDTRILLLDEPTTYLDVRHQLEVMELVRAFAERLTVVMVLHDLDHAARYAGRLLALRDGRLAADGPPADVLSPALLRDVFGVAGRVLTDERYGTPVCRLDAPV
ncbi:ABC transporter ATP-binding protein [Marinitenerispora sediminis]|uniref:Cobalamin/Fe(3+)-siderophore ABC transporter ATP-binding protein n=1 Tax=Marinitenerispora sediminis TaxID=1931232 RepID=A0A368TAW8_9ACTN|nr:ABC transporter ATP-binding protein [Marinitenerispora sediminis]RCV48492.1 cobalamin/Fe(3+)-siderophore ABC transporter ATP-binding protein [Marinitenerispora sediminis]RCV48685.1 cobalamin/Fe(3+)-siderophore ABC transporter ATP-binding protein [Marinitenerispora sediminis]RCV62177.1 cobalamin/Fe(3+)-siderophore ABC transporter ATP-binding protein [Marinitenerispora sediminis]